MAKVKGRIPVRTWGQIRRLWERGESFAYLGREFGVHAVTIRKRRKAEGWVRGGGKEESGLHANGETAPGSQNGTSTPDNSQIPNLDLDTDDPEAFRKTVAAIARKAIQHGAALAGTPQSPRDLVSWISVLKGVQSPDKDAGPASIISPIRTLVREDGPDSPDGPDPLDGFEL